MSESTQEWHRALSRVGRDELSAETTQTNGMTRFEAISRRSVGSERIWMGENHVRGGVNSANHHHGESETGIYILVGNPVFVFLEEGQERRIETKPGDYVYVPPFTAHREENPGTDEAIVVLARSTQDAIVVNLESLESPTTSSELAGATASQETAVAERLL